MNKIKKKYSESRFLIIIIIGIAALILGFIGFSKNALEIGADRTFFDNLYLLLGLFSMNSGAVSGPVSWELQIARFLVPVATGYAAILAFMSIFSQQMQIFKLWFIRDHVVICGLGRKGAKLIEQFKASGKKIIVIESDINNIWIEPMRSIGVIVVNGDATNPEALRKTRLYKAKYLISVLGNEAKNAEVAIHAEEITKDRRGGVLKCIIHISDSNLWYLLREKELYSNSSGKFRLGLFNIYERGANLMINSFLIANSENGAWPKKPHFVVIGLGKLGRSLITQSALYWWENRSNSKHLLQFTIVDINVEKEIGNLIARFPYLLDLCKFIPVQLDINSHDFINSEIFKPRNKPSGIFVCLDNDPLNLQIGLTIKQKAVNQNVPTFLRVAEDSGLAKLIEQNGNSNLSYSELHTFPLLNKTCSPNIILHGTHEIIARELHEYYSRGLQTQSTEEKQDSQIVQWEELDEIVKENNRKQADRICYILNEHQYRVMQLTDFKSAVYKFSDTKANPDVESMARMEHDLWCEEKIKDGWKFGDQKSNKHKTNPALQDWSELPNAEVDKNKNFIRNLPGILLRAGIQIEKK